MKRKEENLKFRLMVVNKLRLLKKVYSYAELSKKLNKPETVLCRYIKGDVTPSESVAQSLWSLMNRNISFSSILKSLLRYDEYGYVDLTPIIQDPYVLTQASSEAMTRFAGKRITKVVTAAVNGIPLTTAVALALEAPIVIAKATKDIGVKEFIEESYPAGSPVSLTTLYVPKRSLTAKDDVLIVDDMIRTGRTVQALINITRKAKARLVGVFTLLAFGDEWRKLLSGIPCPVEVVLSLPSTASPAF
ncbi:MAG: phosphoribosyltransferase family protein [Candidatus Nezhaarchaeales archaeon]